MFDDDSNSKDTGGQKKPSGKGFDKIPFFTLLAWAGIIAAAVVLFLMKQRITTSPIVLSQSEFLTKFQSNQIAHASINLGGQTSMLTPVNGEYIETDKNGKVATVPFVAPNAYFTQKMLDQLLAPPTKVEVGAPNVMLTQFLWGIAPFVI